MLVSLIHYLHAWKRYGSAVRELSNLNDRELADIGITRSDIPFLLSQPAGQSSGSAQVTAHAVHRTA